MRNAKATGSCLAATGERVGCARWWLVPVAIVACCLFASVARAQLPLGIVDTQPNGDAPLSPTASLAKISVPEGFRVTLFAGEPDVHQPIAMEFDDRGRLWVVECYSYPGWQASGKDRILIFEDKDTDGEFDSRKVFADNLRNVSGLALGFGGVWICSAPEFLFIPDRNFDDIPDGPAVVKLDGWNDDEDGVEHNVFNGMKWGPDGWLYGGHGILDNSLVGKPGDPVSKREKINCGIWRYHPVRDKFEIVAHGTTNPWGIDFNELGQGFFTNSVIGHFWHLLPGARYKRMYGSHFNPHTYAVIGECADHFHWGQGRWQDSRDGVGAHGEAGGGHAHVGALIYQGGHWPERFHGSLFTANLHGNRLNRDELKQRGSGYVASHANDFLFGNDPWFRGVGIKCGPDGNVFVSDWTDLGECHDSDGTHRSSGRIYKVHYGESRPHREFDLVNATNQELLGYIDHPNKWFWEHARRLLHERANSGQSMTAVVELARSGLVAPNALSKRLRLASLLALVGGVDEMLLDRMLADQNQHVVSWAVRYLSQETALAPSHVTRLIRLTESTDSLSIRLELAIALQRIPLSRRWSLAATLVEHFPAVPDQNLLPMTWFGIEPLAEQDPERFLGLALLQPRNAQLSELRQYMIRRLLADEKNPDRRIDQILAKSGKLPASAAGDLVVGLMTALEGQRFTSPPKQWDAWRKQHETNPEVRSQILAMGVKFRDAASVASVQNVARDGTRSTQERQAALEALASEGIPGTATLLRELLVDRRIRLAAIKQLAEFNEPAVPAALIGIFRRLRIEERDAAVHAMCSSKSHAAALLEAIERNAIPAHAINPTHAAKINRMRDESLRKKLVSVWGDVRNTPREAKQKIARWKAILTSKRMATPVLEHGQQVYADNCGKCHKLFGEGGDIGPELTGADRSNLDYLLQNVITPSAAVGKEFRMQTVVLLDGRTLSGVVQNKTGTSLELQTVDKKITIARKDIDTIEPTGLSLMPEGQFDVLSEEQVRDLVGYLRSDR